MQVNFKNITIPLPLDGLNKIPIWLNKIMMHSKSADRHPITNKLNNDASKSTRNHN